jgi:ketosteroid isomerase-like protein
VEELNGSADVDELVRRFLAALSAGDRAAVGELVHPEVEIRTERTVHRGRVAAMEWSGKTFDHLVRRYVPVEIEHRPGGVLVHAELQYVWRDSDRVGDRSKVAIELGIRDGLVSSWYLLDEPEDVAPE